MKLLLACPKCGAPLPVDDETVTAGCAHCASLLRVSAPERDEIGVVDGQVKDATDVLEIAILYRVESQRAEIVSRYQDRDGNPPPELFVRQRLAAYEKDLRRVAHVAEARSFHVPYWHITGTILQGILGRYADGPKIVRLRAFAVEHSIPAYDTRRANLRDRGLRLASALVRPLTVKDLAHCRPFLPWVAVAERSHREIDKWRNWDLDPGIDPVTKHGSFLFPRRMLVYRPYWLARVFLDTGQESVLVDGSFATLAGHPDELEARALLGLGVPDPLRSGEECFRRVHVIASRCPDCGFEQRFSPRQVLSVCPNCHLGLEPGPAGIGVRRYAHARGRSPSLDALHLPFWRYEFRVEGVGAPVVRLEDYARALFPQGPPQGFEPSGSHLWVPAFRLLGTEIGDEAFAGLVRWIHGARLVVEEGKVPLGGRPDLRGVSVPEAEARALGPFLLFGLHGRPSASRLNTLLLKKAVVGAKLELRGPELVLVPFDRDAEAVGIEGTDVRFPLLLLSGGPELEAQRATVHGTRTETWGL